MQDYMQKFVKEHIKEIEELDLNKLYGEVDSLYCSSLTALLYNVGIDPLQHIEAVPREFANHLTWLNIDKIPGNIIAIYSKAFMDTGIEYLKVEEGVQHIHATAFANCKKLHTIELPVSLTRIGTAAFFASSLTTIKYAGSSSDWYNIEFGSNWIAPRHKLNVFCNDQVIVEYQ